jgi:hypothetical protein
MKLSGFGSPSIVRFFWFCSPVGTREINVHSVGNKRELIPDEVCWPDYVTVPGAKRGAATASSGPFPRSTMTGRYPVRACRSGSMRG